MANKVSTGIYKFVFEHTYAHIHISSNRIAVCRVANMLTTKSVCTYIYIFLNKAPNFNKLQVYVSASKFA